MQGFGVFHMPGCDTLVFFYVFNKGLVSQDSRVRKFISFMGLMVL